MGRPPAGPPFVPECYNVGKAMFKTYWVTLHLGRDLLVVVTGGLAHFFRLYEEIQPVWGGILAIDNRDLGKVGQPGIHINAYRFF